MIGAYGTQSAAYLTLLALFMLPTFGIPMALWPLRWAAILGWRMPDEKDLAVYFGRCLGCVVVALATGSLLVARQPALQPAWFGLLTEIGSLMVVVHAYGAWRGIQPRSESLEIVFWLAQVVVTLVFWPATPD